MKRWLIIALMLLVLGLVFSAGCGQTFRGMREDLVGTWEAAGKVFGSSPPPLEQKKEVKK